MSIQAPESNLLSIEQVEQQIREHRESLERLEAIRQGLESGQKWLYSGAARELLARDGKPIEKAHLAHHIRAGRLAPIKVGHFNYFANSDIEQFVRYSPDYSRTRGGKKKGKAEP